MNSPRSFLSAVSLFRMLREIGISVWPPDAVNMYLISASRIGSSVDVAD